MALFTLNELKAFVGIDTSVTTEDTILTIAQAAGESEAKKALGSDVEDAGSASARKYVPTSQWECFTDFFNTTTGLVIKTDDDADGVFETTWPSTAYELHPVNGKLNGETWPYFRIEAVDTSYFPINTGRSVSVQVTARWGWATVPDAVKLAAMILAASDERVRALVRGEGGFTRWSREQAYELLDPYRLHPNAAKVG